MIGWSNLHSNTSLTGAAITSTAEQSKNSLQTQSIDYNDLINKESTAAGSVSLSLSTSNAASNITNNLMSNIAGQAALPKSGSSQSDTKSVISPANITITGTGNATKDQASKEATATLTSRDASTANAGLKNTLSLQQVAELEAKQRDMADKLAAANAVGSVVTNIIGDYAHDKHKELQAQENAKAKAENRDPVKVQTWADGSSEKIALHGLAGLIQAKVGGNNALAGAFTGALYEASVPKLVAAIDSLQKDQRTDLVNQYKALANMADGADKDQAKKQLDTQWNTLDQEKKSMVELGSVAIGATAGKVIGGNLQTANVAANMALTADQNNRQLHPNEIKWIKDNAKRYAALNPGMTAAEAEKLLAQQAFREVQFGVAGETDVKAQAFLKNNTVGMMLPGDSTIPGQNVGYMFRATPDQKANANMYLNEVINSPQALEFYQRNQIKQPNLQQIMNAATTDSAKRSVVLQRTILAAVAAGSLVLAPAFAGTAAEVAAFAKNPFGYCLSNPIGCTIGGMVGADVLVATVAGVPVSGVSIPNVGTVAGKLAAIEGKVAATEAKVVVDEVKTAANTVANVEAAAGRSLSVTSIDPATGVATINPTTSVSRSQISRLSSDATTATSNEVQVAAQLENATGSTIKMIDPPVGVPGQVTPKSPDFVFESGTNAGKTGDFMFTAEQKSVPYMNANFEKNWTEKTLVSLNSHLGKADIVVLDYRNLTAANQQIVNNWINTLTPAQRAQILIVR